jgi:CRP/FNR family transcriptional regulator
MENQTNTELYKFFSQYKTISFKKGETILHPDSIPSGVFYLKRGHVRLYRISEDGMEFTVLIYKPGTLFPLRWAINNVDNIYYFESITNVELFSCPKAEFLEEFKKGKTLAEATLDQTLFDYGALIYRMQHIVFGNAYAKVASIILTAAKRFGETTNKELTVPIRFTHQQIALSAGITRETASIEIKKLENNGVISYKERYIIVKDLPKLEEISFL